MPPAAKTDSSNRPSPSNRPSSQNQLSQSHLSNSPWLGNPLQDASHSTRQPDEALRLHPFNTLPTLTLKQRIVKQLHLLSYRSGLSPLYARLSQKLNKTSVATILLYHSVPAPPEVPWMDPCNCISPVAFDEQMQFLAANRHVISLDDLLGQIERGEPIRRGTVAITFDDGYLNNFTVAAPILAKYGLPATLYLATAFVEKGENQWIDTLYSAFSARSQHQLTLSNLGKLDRGNWCLEREAEALEAYRTIASALIEASVSQRQSILNDINQQLAPTAYPPRLTLNWDEVRQMQQQYPNITLGIHTANHLDLSTHSDQTTAEIKLAIHHMATATGQQPQHLAFPYDRYNDEALAQVTAINLRSAMAETPDSVIRSDTSFYPLPRLDAPRTMSVLKSWTNGGFPDLSRKLFRRVWVQPY